MRTRLLTAALALSVLSIARAQPAADEKPAPAPEAAAPAVETPAAPAPAAAEAAPAAPAPAPEAAPAAPAAPAAAAAAAPATEGAPAPALARTKQDTLSVDFPDEEIRTVLRNVADLFELNLVIPDTLQGKTTIKLRDVTWRQIFKVVLDPVGFAFVEDGNIVKVVSQESLNLEPLTTEVFIINYARAQDIKPSIDALIDTTRPGARIVVDARSNALVVTERPSAIQRIKPIILQLDTATEQVMIESKFIEVNNNDVHNLGVSWNSLKGYGIQAKPNNLNVRGGSATRDEDGTLLSEVQTKASSMFSAVFSAPEFSTLIHALNTDSKSKLVSNPTVVTLNNSEAAINIGQEYPIPNYTYNQERGAFEVSGFTYKPIGIILKVTPQVNSQGFIRLSIEPEVSVRSGDARFGNEGGASATIPIIDVKKTKTQITLKDGYTLGIGGLVETSSVRGSSRVPVLGSIPGLGRLFSSKSHDDKTRNLLVFITAKTLKPDGTGEVPINQVFDPRVMREIQLQKTDLPGYRESGDPFYVPPPAPEPRKK